MVLVSYPNNINTKFFSYSATPKNNVTLTEYASGRVVGYQKNTKKLMNINCSVRYTKTELAAFWIWFNDTLGQTAGAFTCSALGSGYYRFLNVPTIDTDQKVNVLNFELEEV